MNWAAGQGFTQSFLGTLQGLTALERAQLEAEDFRERRTREKQFRDITAEELGRVGQLPQTSTGALREATGVMPAEQTSSAIPMDASAAPSLRQAAGVREGRSSVGAQASAMPASTSSVTREDALLRIMERGMAVDPDRAFDMALKGMQLEDVLATNKSKKEFRQWQSGFNNELTNLKNLADMAETNPQEFLTGAKKLGIDVRPVSTGGGKQIFEAYMNGQKMGQYDSLSAAANDGLERYSTNMLIQGAAKFATTPEQFVTILSTSERINMDRRRLGLEESKEAREAKMQPVKIRQLEAAIKESNAKAAKAGYETSKLKRMEEMNNELQNLLKNPVENAAAIQALAAQMEALFPEVYVKTGKITRDGEEVLGTVGILTPTANKALEAAGVVRLPVEVKNAVEQAATRAGGDPKKFANDPTVKKILEAQPRVTLQDLEKAAGITRAQPAAPASAIPAQTSAPPARTGRGAAIPAGDRIPEPPPKELIRGTNRRPNPAYAEWEQKFGERYRAQQR